MPRPDPTPPRGGHCDHGSPSVAGARSERRRSCSPSGRFLPDFRTPADTTLRRRGLHQGIKLSTLFNHAVTQQQVRHGRNG